MKTEYLPTFIKDLVDYEQNNTINVKIIKIKI
jgi:hypothetical protein